MRAVFSLLGLLACGDPPPPLPSERPPEARPTPTNTAEAGAWTPETIGGLQPVAPSREGRVARPIEQTAEIAAALATLGAVVDRYAADPKNPWAVAHGLLARGQGFALSDGRPAVDALLEDWSEPVQVGGLSLLRFPSRKGEARVEPHTALQLKNMSEVGVAPDRAVVVGGQDRTVADLYRGTVVSSWLDMTGNKASFSSPDDVGWLVQAIAAWAPADGLSWRSTEGVSTDLALLTRFSVAALVKETAFLAEAMAAGQGFERKGQGIFRYTCGGAHLLQGAAYAVARGYGSDKEQAAMKAQAAILLYRFPREQAITDSALQSHPDHRLRLMSQRLKFAGHALESASKLVILGFLEPGEAELGAMADMARSIAETTTALDRGGAFTKLPELRAQDEQLYLDLVGDAAHAVRGLELALGRQALPW